MRSRLGLVVLALVVAAGCVTNNDSGRPNPDAPPQQQPDAPPGNCAMLAGQWDIDGACGDDNCTITQVGCGITGVTCTSGSRSTSGSINGNQFSYTGTSGGGAPATCNGTISGATIAGTCTSLGVPCNFTGARM
jgi:hypothetical protein